MAAPQHPGLNAMCPAGLSATMAQIRANPTAAPVFQTPQVPQMQRPFQGQQGLPMQPAAFQPAPQQGRVLGAEVQPQRTPVQMAQPQVLCTTPYQQQAMPILAEQPRVLPTMYARAAQPTAAAPAIVAQTQAANIVRPLEAIVKPVPQEESEADVADKYNPFCPLEFPFLDRDFYANMYGSRHHTVGEGWSSGSHGPVEKGYTYNEKVGTCAAFYVSVEGQEPAKMQEGTEVEFLQVLASMNNIKVGGWGSGMKDKDYWHSIGQISPFGDATKAFVGQFTEEEFTMKNETMRMAYLDALVGVTTPLVQGMIEDSNGESFLVHWDGDELYDNYGNTFNNYGPMVWAIASILHSSGKLGALLAVKNARTKWTKALGSELENSREDQWYRNEREGANGEPRQHFAARYFAESKIQDMIEFVSQHSPEAAKPQFFCLTHSTEKNRYISDRQDGSGFAYFGASVQSAMATAPGAVARVVMVGGGDVIYKELSNDSWTGRAAKDAVKGYKPGTQVIAFDVLRKEQSQRCKVFEQDGEPEPLFGTLMGRVLTAK